MLSSSFLPSFLFSFWLQWDQFSLSYYFFFLYSPFYNSYLLYSFWLFARFYYFFLFLKWPLAGSSLFIPSFSSPPSTYSSFFFHFYFFVFLILFTSNITLVFFPFLPSWTGILLVHIAYLFSSTPIRLLVFGQWLFLISYYCILIVDVSIDWGCFCNSFSLSVLVPWAWDNVWQLSYTPVRWWETVCWPCHNPVLNSSIERIWEIKNSS
jgi:hypothetical protein